MSLFKYVNSEVEHVKQITAKGRANALELEIINVDAEIMKRAAAGLDNLSIRVPSTLLEELIEKYNGRGYTAKKLKMPKEAGRIYLSFCDANLEVKW